MLLGMPPFQQPRLDPAVFALKDGFDLGQRDPTRARTRIVPASKTIPTVLRLERVRLQVSRSPWMSMECIGLFIDPGLDVLHNSLGVWPSVRMGWPTRTVMQPAA